MRHLSLLNYTFTIILLYLFLKNSTRFRDKPLRGLRVQRAQRVVLSSIPEGACACGAEGHMASIGPPALGAKSCVERLHPTGETTHYDLCVAGAPANHVRCASLRSGGRRLAVRKTIEYQIGALLRTPFPAAREFPSRGNERYEEKNRESYTSCTTPAFPLWWLTPPP